MTETGTFSPLNGSEFLVASGMWDLGWSGCLGTTSKGWKVDTWSGWSWHLHLALYISWIHSGQAGQEWTHKRLFSYLLSIQA